ncbi:MAG: hypothetical protein RDV48_20545 [Candidatus Eremiobacteraeota bacterium]|nr:hypothetical protein [Candidatus Eremiobacteraeota bacterium]
MRLTIDEPAKKALRKLDKAVRCKIGIEIDRYQAGLPVNIKKIKTSDNTWRIAVEKWRIIIKYDPNAQVMHVTSVIQRKDAYRQ